MKFQLDLSGRPKTSENNKSHSVVVWDIEEQDQRKVLGIMYNLEEIQEIPMKHCMNALMQWIVLNPNYPSDKGR